MGAMGGGGGVAASQMRRRALSLRCAKRLTSGKRLSAPKARRRFSRRGATWFTNVCTSSSFRPFRPFFSLAAAKA